MTQDDPYTPPKTAGSEAAALRYWNCDGECAIAKNGAVLPRVDLETGVSDVEMIAVSRSYQPFGISQGLRSLLMIGVYFAVRNSAILASDQGIWMLVGGAILLSWILRLTSGVGGTIMIWEYREAALERRRALRRKQRCGLLVTAFSLVILGPWLLTASYFLSIQLIVAGCGLLIVSVIWRIVDAPKTRCGFAPHRWMRIRRIHPDAMLKLRVIERTERSETTSTDFTRARQVYTVFLYRYPLKLLIGQSTRNPLTILIIILMKLFRSDRLEREAFEFSEAEDIRADEIKTILSKQLIDWHADHPDWILCQRQRLASPSGDLTVDSVFLRSPRWEHVLCMHHTWTVRNPEKGVVESSLLTWMKGGNILSTGQTPALPLQRPDQEFAQCQGDARELLEVHQRRCANRQISPAENLEQLLVRLVTEKKNVSEALEIAGLRGPSRDAR
jgi:hypothetical protein